MERNLIDKRYFPSLICADVIKLGHQSYGLIQPVVSFIELHKVIGTSNSEGNDRSVWAESVWGPQYYTTITSQDNYFGLSMALMFSLLLSAHSVHSSNIVVLNDKDNIPRNNKQPNKQFARIDWGDAFRYFAHEENNEDILYSYENQGFTYKRATKNYLLNYKNINGLYPAMASKAHELRQKLDPDLLSAIVKSALSKMPADLITQKTQEKLAQYMWLPSLQKATFGPQGRHDAFASDLAHHLNLRLDKISGLDNLSPSNSQEDIYESFIEEPPLQLEVKSSQTFLQTIDQWSAILQKDGVENQPFAGDSLDLPALVTQFNHYVDELALQSDVNHVWKLKNAAGKNILTQYDNSQGDVILGHAFVPFYKESAVLRHLFKIDPKTFNLKRFAAFEKPNELYIKDHSQSVWAETQKLLTLGNMMINTLKTIKNAQNFGMDDAVFEAIKQLKQQLYDFQQANKALPKALKAPFSETPQTNAEHSFFYPIDDKDLAAMTGGQLTTICLEELNDGPSLLMARILSNDALWTKIDDALNSEDFKGRTDHLTEKTAKIYEWRKLLQIANQRSASQMAPLQKEVKHFQALEKEHQQLRHDSDEQSKRIGELQSQVTQTENENAQLIKKAEKLESLTEKNQQLQQQAGMQANRIGALESEIAHAQQNIAQLKTKAEELEPLTKENQQLRQQAAMQANRIGALESQIEKAENKNAKLIKKAEKLESLTKENQQLRQQANMQTTRITALESQMEKAESRHQKALQRTVARAKQTAPLDKQIAIITAKAEEFKNRNEKKASHAAYTLANNLEQAINDYCQDESEDEAALNTLKTTAQKHIDTSKEVLNKHRSAWKPILANVAMAFLLLGAGYIPAVLIHKQVTGHYAFFSSTDSGKKLQDLERTVSSEISLKS